MKFLMPAFGAVGGGFFVVLVLGLADGNEKLLFSGLAGLNTAICLHQFLRSFQNEERDIFNPISIFIIFFFFYHVMPVLALIATSSEPIDIAAYMPALWVTFAAILSFEAGLILFRPRRLSAIPALAVNNMFQLSIPLILVVAGPFMGTIGFGSAQIGFLIVLFALLAMKDSRDLPIRIICIIFVVYALYISRSEFSRAFILQSGLMILIFYNYYVRRLVLIEFLLISIIALFLLFIMAFLRGYDQLFEGEAFAFSRFVTYMNNFFILTDFTPATASRFLRTTDFPMAYESFRMVVENVPRNVDYLFGETYLKYLLFVVPRDIYPDKPIDLHTLYVHVFLNPHSVHYSNSPLLLGELYWNGGYLGVILGMLLSAAMVKWVCRYRRLVSSNNLYFSLYIVFLTTLPLFMRGSTATITIHVITVQIVPTLLIFLFLNLLSYNRRRSLS